MEKWKCLNFFESFHIFIIAVDMSTQVDYFFLNKTSNFKYIGVAQSKDKLWVPGWLRRLSI